MKLVLTLTEVARLFVNHYSLPTDTTVEIAPSQEPPSQPRSARNLSPNDMADQINFILRAGDCLDANGHLVVGKKIAAIKLLRAFLNTDTDTECSLIKAKQAVENYPRFLDYVRKHGVPPMRPNDDVAWDAVL